MAAEHPRSPLAPRALWQLGVLHGALGQVELAADALARLATRYPGEREAPDALWNLVLYRVALGDDAGAAAAAAQFVRNYGKTRPADVAQLRVDLADRLRARGDEAAADAAYAAVLAGPHQDHALTVRVVLARADLAWARACPIATTAGLCLRVGPAGATPVARRTADARAAQAGFARVVDGSAPDDPTVAAAVARARLHQAERAIEATLAMAPMPTLTLDRDGRPSPASTKAVTAWLTAWQRSITDTDRAIEQVLVARDGASAVAVVARAALFYDRLATTLTTARVPRALRGQPEARWRLREADLADFAASQVAIASKAAALLAPGGRMIYATCTLIADENQAVVDAVARARGLRIVPLAEAWDARAAAVATADGRFLTVDPDRHGTDGFFAAVLERPR